MSDMGCFSSGGVVENVKIVENVYKKVWQHPLPPGRAPGR